MSILTKLFGDPNKRVIDKIQPLVFQINELEKDFEKLSAEELKNKTIEFRQRLAQGETLDDFLPETFATVRQAAKRTLGQRHFDVQLIGGVVLHQGAIAEMRTGEGKTLTATLAVYLNALEGKGVHIVTVNDYLAKRDTVWMGQIYHALGLSVGCIQQQMTSFVYEPGYQDLPPALGGRVEGYPPLGKGRIKEGLINQPPLTPSFQGGEGGSLVKIEPSHLRPCSRQEAYRCDITYGTNNEFGFDYLRDNMVSRLEEMSQRELNYAIVDEVDSILVDEARTPLIISAPAEEATDKYYQFAELVSRLKENEDYNIDEKMRAATFTEEGINKLEKWLGVKNIYDEGGMATVHHLEQALRAQALFKLDRDYVVKDGEVIIVDEFTGRLMFGRRYSEGLHQAIEAKEKVEIKRESQTLATITFQNYFRLYKKLAGMTGTAATEAEEFSKIYNLEVVEIPTNQPMVRRDLADRIYKNESGKFTAVIREIKEKHERGQPVLVGTISIEKNEQLSEMLLRQGILHQVLNAKNHEKEAEIIAQAGRLGAVTLATNMAGRGVDIILGGNKELSLRPRQGGGSNPDDERDLRALVGTAMSENGLAELEKEWRNEQKKVIAAGGLHVLGTERHESRRIDNQLRGRSGRQGDPGSSQFYVSMEDDLMRIFGSDRLKKMMEFLKVPEDMPIENKMVSRSLESAQKKVEGHNFDIRKHLLDYDDVLNKHRTVIYRKRKEILEEYTRIKSANISELNANKSEFNRKVEPIIARHPERSEGSLSDNSRDSSVASLPQNDVARATLKSRILEMVEQEVEQFVYFHTGGTAAGDWNIQEIFETALTIFPVSDSEKEELFKLGGRESGRLAEAEARTKIIELLTNLAKVRYSELEKKINNPELMLEIEKSILLRAMDTLWIEHLVAIDYLRAGIGLRGYGQRDPLVEYKKEAYRLFNELTALIQKEVVYSIYKVGLGVDLAPSLMQRQGIQMSGAVKEGGGGGAFVSKPKEFSHTIAGAKVGRNDPCPCGAKKPDGTPIKYKHCHGKNV